MENKTDRLIDHLYELKNSSFSADIINQVKRCLLDYLGVTFAGAKLLNEKVNSILDFSDGESNKITAIGLNRKTDIYTATLVNGLTSHVTELDDGSRYGAIHPGSPIFSALLPLAEKENTSAKDFINAVVLAYETAILLSSAIQPSHYNMGYHPTATCGSIGTAVGAATILGFNKKQFKDTFSAAAISASGTLKVIEDGSELKPYNAGNAALNGLMAAITAGSNFSGPEDVLSGDTGFLAMMAQENNFSNSFNHGTPLINRVYVKPYAACRHAHPSIEAALIIKNTSQFNVNEIKKITIKTYKGIIGKHDTKKITNPYSAKMSIPFSVAVALIKGSAGINDFSDDNINDSNIISLTNKIFIEEDNELSALVPDKRVAIMEIDFGNNMILTERVDYPKGEPENPMTDAEINEKFQSLSNFSGKSQIASDGIINKVWNLEKEFINLFEFL
ncbi:MAG TPA: MmgE/PrpD family protein [Bacteroidia bacterium]|nr:MmgE/PrpD family protein [Bacteroidia bacterium]